MPAMIQSELGTLFGERLDMSHTRRYKLFESSSLALEGGST